MTRPRTLVENPPWVTKIISDHWSMLEESAPPAWLPKLDRTHAKGVRMSGRMKEFGCGAYGCVLPTLDKKVVLKVTTDETEAHFAAQYANKLPVPICTIYHLVMEIPGAKRNNMKVFLLWREEAFNVGQVDTVVGEHAEDAISKQHERAQEAFKHLHTGRNDKFAQYALDDWRDSVLEMGAIPELAWLADGIVEAYDEQGIFFGDIHGGNIGQVNRDGVDHWVITDPGNMAVRGRPLAAAEPIKNPRDPSVHAGMTPREILDAHERLKLDDATWKSLRLVGIQKADPRFKDDPEEVDLEMRDCPCGSTLVRPVVPAPHQNPCTCR